MNEDLFDGIKKAKIFHKKEYEEALNTLKDLLKRKGNSKPSFYASRVAQSYPHVDAKELLKMLEEGKITVHFKKGSFEDSEVYKSEDEAKKSIKILKDEGFKITKVIGSKKLEEEDMTQQNPMQGKIDNLLRSGFVDKTEVAVARRAIQKLNSDETLTPDERSLIQRVFKKLLDIVTKKDSIFGSVRKSLSVQEESLHEGAEATKIYQAILNSAAEKTLNAMFGGSNNPRREAYPNIDASIFGKTSKQMEADFNVVYKKIETAHYAKFEKNKDAKNNIRKNKEVVKEEEEDLNELSTKTYASYIKKRGAILTGANGETKGINRALRGINRNQALKNQRAMDKDKSVKESFKVGDKVHVGLAVKGGAGYKGKVKKLEGDYVFVEPHDSHKEKFGGRLIRGHIKNTKMDEETFDLSDASPDDLIEGLLALVKE